MSMKWGAVYPQAEVAWGPEAIKEFVQGVESLGFDYLLSYEHILGAEAESYPDQSFIYTHEHPFREPFVLYSYLAGMTTTLEFVTGILVLPQRDVRLVAKQAADLSALSGGRFRLGVGGGWNRAEFQSLGADFSKRGRLMDEQLELLHRLWTEPLVDFEGEFHQVTRCGINPLPSPPPPIYVGGTADAVLKRAARFAQGWLPATLPKGGPAPLIKKLRRYLDEEGRDPEEFGIDARIAVSKEPQETWRQAIDLWVELGATHLRCQTLGCGFTRPEQHLEVLERFLQTAKG